VETEDPTLTSFDHSYDIDTGIDTVLAHMATRSASNTRIPKTIWYDLSSEGRDLWQSFSEADKAILLSGAAQHGSRASHRPSRPNSQRSPGSNSSNTPSTKFSSYFSELSIEDDDPAPSPADTMAPSASSSDTSDNVLLANVTKQKRTWTQPRGSDLPPSDIRKVLSTENTRKASKVDQTNANEIVINGTHYRAVNVARIYSVSSTHRTTASGSLVDRGANGGITGDDVRIINKTMRTVDVRGIDNHEVTGIPIVTAGGVINTQHGPVIAIMPQYAYLGGGKTIHSAGQLEYYQNDVNDRSVKV